MRAAQEGPAMRTFRLIASVIALLTASTVMGQTPLSVIDTVAANSPATLTLDSRIDYFDAKHDLTPISVQVKASFDLNLDLTGALPMTFTGAGAVKHTRLDVSGLDSVMKPQCNASMTAADGSMVARIRYSPGGDPVLEIGNLGSILETLVTGGYCPYANTTNIWGGPYSLLHQDEMLDPGYYQFSIKDWTQLGPLTPDGPVTFFKDYARGTSNLGSEPVVPLFPMSEAREVTHVEFTIYARSPVTNPTPPLRRRAVRHH
jgi:hypothetical protein